MTTADYSAVAASYEALMREPLYADETWVEPLYESAEVAVGTEGGSAAFLAAETVARTVLAIVALTYGAKGLREAMK